MSKTILVVDDDQVILNTLTLILKSRGHKPMIARDGPETLACIRREKPDLILLDLMFPPDPANICGPLRDGFFIIEWLRHTPGAEQIPIVIISSTDPAKYKDRAMAAGVVACLQKPLKRGEILEAIDQVLAKIASSNYS